MALVLAGALPVLDPYPDMGVGSRYLNHFWWTLLPGERTLMDIGEERKMVEFDPLETETPAPVETPVPAPSTPVEAPAEEPVGV